MLQSLPLAGAVAVARRSIPAAALFLGWLLGYVVVKGAAEVATVESGSYWRLIMPALPGVRSALGGRAAARPVVRPTGMRRARAAGRAPPPAGCARRLRRPSRAVAVIGSHPLDSLVAAAAPTCTRLVLAS